MYEFRYALVKHRAPNVRFEEIDVRDITLSDLQSQYLDVFMVLTNPFLDQPHTLALSSISGEIIASNNNLTVSEWLDVVGDSTLDTVPGQPYIKASTVLARDAWQAGYTADLCLPMVSPLNDAIDSDKTDIWLKREDTDYVELQRHCLTTVNGYVHRTDADSNGLYIRSGGDTFRKGGMANIGIISFASVGRVRTYDITPEMVYQPRPSRLFSDQFYLRLPFDATDKVVGIVIGGHLHLIDNAITVTGPNTLRVDTNRIPLVERYMTSRYQINLTALERFHEVAEDNPTDYDQQMFMSNECILELLTNTHSFLVSIDVEHLTKRIVPLVRTRLPGRFYFDGRPMFPLRTELGILPSYISEEEKGGYWVLRIDNNMSQHRLLSTYPHRWDDKMDEKRVSGQPETFSRGEMVEYTTYRLEIKED